MHPSPTPGVIAGGSGTSEPAQPAVGFILRCGSRWANNEQMRQQLREISDFRPHRFQDRLTLSHLQISEQRFETDRRSCGGAQLPTNKNSKVLP